jgi:hypothetical protein
LPCKSLITSDLSNVPINSSKKLRRIYAYLSRENFRSKLKALNPQLTKPRSTRASAIYRRDCFIFRGIPPTAPPPAQVSNPDSQTSGHSTQEALTGKYGHYKPRNKFSSICFPLTRKSEPKKIRSGLSLIYFW